MLDVTLERDPGRRSWTSQSAKRCQRLLVLGKLASLRYRVDHLPPDDAGLVDDERTARGDTTLIIEHTVRLGHLAVRPEIGQQPELVAFGLCPGLVHEYGVDGNGEHF